MKVVRRVMPGTQALNFSRSVSICLRVTLRRMVWRIWSLMCWRGMSMYLTTFLQSARVLIISSVKQLG